MTIVIPANTRDYSVDIAPIADGQIEPEQKIYYSLGAGDGYALAEAKPMLTLTLLSIDVLEVEITALQSAYLNGFLDWCSANRIRSVGTINAHPGSKEASPQLVTAWLPGAALIVVSVKE